MLSTASTSRLRAAAVTLALATTAAVAALAPGQAAAAEISAPTYCGAETRLYAGTNPWKGGTHYARACQKRGAPNTITAQYSMVTSNSYHGVWLDTRTHNQQLNRFVFSRMGVPVSVGSRQSRTYTFTADYRHKLSSDVRLRFDVKDDGKGILCTPWSITGYR